MSKDFGIYRVMVGPKFTGIAFTSEDEAWEFIEEYFGPFVSQTYVDVSQTSVESSNFKVYKSVNEFKTENSTLKMNDNLIKILEEKVQLPFILSCIQSKYEKGKCEEKTTHKSVFSLKDIRSICKYCEKMFSKLAFKNNTSVYVSLNDEDIRVEVAFEQYKVIKKVLEMTEEKLKELRNISENDDENDDENGME